MESFEFYRVSDVEHRKFRVRLCTCISELTLDVLIGADALNRANTVFILVVPSVHGFVINVTILS